MDLHNTAEPCEPGSGAASGAPGPAAPAFVLAREGRRQRYVIGIFADPANADRALSDLALKPCEVLVVADTARSTGAAPDSNFPDALAIPGLWDGSSAHPPATSLGTPIHTPANTQRLVQTLDRHRKAGATIVIVHTANQHLQLEISRAILDAKCDALLTHEVATAPRPAAADAPHDKEEDACCGACTKKSCRAD